MSTTAPHGLDGLGCGIEQSVSISFTPSAGDDCHDGCRMRKPINGTKPACYALNHEKRFKHLAAELRRRRENPTIYINKAALAINYLRNYFVRISKFGTVLNRQEANKTRGYLPALQLFLQRVAAGGNRLQWFIEDRAKVKFYRDLLKTWKLNFIIRESVQSIAALNRRPIGEHLAIVCGDNGDGLSIAERIDKAHALAAAQRAKGRTAIVCGKVRGASDARDPRKCGECNACIEPLVELIILPKHR